jgi:hypothetical protein
MKIKFHFRSNCFQFGSNLISIRICGKYQLPHNCISWLAMAVASGKLLHTKTPLQNTETSIEGRVAPHPAGGVCQARPKRRRRGGGGGWGREEEEQGCEQEGRRGIGGALRAGERPAGAAPGGRGSGPSDVGARPALLAAHGAPPSRRRGLALPQEQAPALRADAARAAGAAGGGRGRVRFFYMYHYPPTGRPDSHF